MDLYPSCWKERHLLYLEANSLSLSSPSWVSPLLSAHDLQNHRYGFPTGGHPSKHGALRALATSHLLLLFTSGLVEFQCHPGVKTKAEIIVEDIKRELKLRVRGNTTKSEALMKVKWLFSYSINTHMWLSKAEFNGKMLSYPWGGWMGWNSS